MVESEARSVKPLDGLKIIDLTTFLSGPFGTQILGDLGADVLKVEPPTGDSSRAIPPHFIGEESAYYLGNNRNKRSIAVDLKTADGLRIVKDLIAQADVVVENFRPGVCTRLGLDINQIRTDFPGIIWASISGFGQTGPLKENPAYDMIVQALSGVMSLTGEEGRPAMRLGIPAGDLVAGMFAVVGILSAAFRRLATGRGSVIDVSMLDGQLSMVSYQAVYAMISGETPGPQGARHDSIPTYRSFTAGDGREFVVTANTNRMWASLCRALELPHLIDDPRFATATGRLTRQQELWDILEPAFLTRPAAEWVELLRTVSVPAAPISTVTEALAQAEATGRNMVLPLDNGQGNGVKVIGNPIKFTGEPESPDDFRYPPQLGEHTTAVLLSLGYEQDRIDKLLQRGTVVDSSSRAKAAQQ